MSVLPHSILPELPLTRLKVLFGNFAESRPRDFEEAIDEEEFPEDYGYLSDSDLEDSEDEISLPKPATEPKAYPFGLPSKSETILEGHEEHEGKGKVVKIPDMAFVM